MDGGLFLGTAGLIFFAIMLIVSINNDIRKKKEENSFNTLKTCSNNEETTQALLKELLITAKSSDTKLNKIMWIMLIPIIINLIGLFLAISSINELIAKITSLF